MKDFTTVLDMRLEFQREILSQLREIYDGYFKKRWGTKKTFEWQGKMGFLAGVTDVIYRRHKVISQMGERWVYYRIENDSPLERAKQAFRMAGKEDAIRAEIKMGFHDFLTSLPRHNRPLEDESKLEETFAALATLVTVARTPVQRDGVNKIILNKPSPEGPFRFVKQMLKIARALCRVHQTEVMTDAVYKVIIKTSVDSIPTMRWKVLEWLWANKDTVDFSIVDIERSTRTPRITLTYYLDELVILELVDRAGHRFSLSPLAREIFEGSGM